MGIVNQSPKNAVTSPRAALALLFVLLALPTGAQSQGPTVSGQSDNTLISVDPSPHPSQVTTHSVTAVQFTGKGLAKTSENASCTFTWSDKKKNINQTTPLTISSDTACSCLTPGDLSAGHYELKLTIPSAGAATVITTHRFNVVHYTEHPPQACQSCTADECRVTKTKRHLGFCCRTQPPTNASSTEPFSPTCQVTLYIAGLAPWEWVIVGVSAVVFIIVVVVISVALTKKSCNKVARPYKPINDLPDHPTSQQPSILF